MPQFPFPVGVLLFNRPQYAEQTLRALANQQRSVPGNRVVIVIDGYDGSKSQKSGQADHTADVARIARDIFPDATIIASQQNVGIAVAFDLLEVALRRCDPQSKWYAFFEEDYVPHENYLGILADLARQSSQLPEIVAITATGELFVERSRGVNSVYPLSRLWAFLIRSSHLDERRPIIDEYLAAFSDTSYWERNKPAIARVLANTGVLPVGVSQDQVKLTLLGHFGRYGISTGSTQGEYIGVVGEHMDEKSYASFGFEKFTRAFDSSQVDLTALAPTLAREARVGFATKVADAYVIPRFVAFEARQRERARPRLSRAISAFVRGVRILAGRET
ncbi:MAG: glycosyltransferase [Microbacteriaceae bacterium]|nr:glycosyltransferase [Microbacteriaceae bacterium]